jgi:hypothetical protein
MARHILAGEGHPVFYWGVAYAGSLEPHFVAAVFAVLGPSVTSYRLAIGILFSLLALGVFALTRWLFGDRAGLFALAYFALPPFFLLFKGLTSDGAYDSVALHALATIALAVAIDRSAVTWRALLYGLLGIAIGAGWWVMPITITVSAIAVLWLLAQRRRHPSPAGAATFVGGLIAGSFPWWFWNLRHGWESLSATEMGVVGLGQVARNVVSVLQVSIPILEGALRTLPEAPWLRASFPGATAVSLLTLAVFLVPLAGRAVRGDSVLRLLLASLLVLLASAFSRRFLHYDPRLSIAYYSVAPVLIGSELARRSGGRSPIVRRIAAGLALAAVHVASLVGARVDFHNDGNDVTGSLQNLIGALESEGVRNVYANYWTAYRLAFDSGEKIIATPILGYDTVRYAPYQEAVDRAGRPAVVLLPPRDECYGSFLRERGIPFRRRQVDEFGVYLDLGPEALRTLRRGFGLPMPKEGYRVAWRLGPQPSSLLAGSSTSVSAEVTNLGPCEWPVFVHVGYHWWPLDPGGVGMFDAGRGFPSGPVKPGESENFSLPLIAPDAPGRYRLEYDLVYEMVEWFSTMAGQTQSIEVRVVPRTAGPS